MSVRETMTGSGADAPPTSAPNAPPTYPVHLVLTGRRCLVVGGGNVAVRKIGGLLRSGALVTVVAPEIRDEIRALDVSLIERAYQPSDLEGQRLVITCTDDRAVNAAVYADAESIGVWANSADDPVNCAFTLPSVARQGDLAVTVSTTGRSPALSAWLRRRFEREFDESYAALLDVLADVRAEARTTLGTSEIRGWNEALDDGLLELVADGELDLARERLRKYLGLTDRVVPTGAPS